MAEITTADEWFERYWCGCGRPEEAAEALREVFAIFPRRWEDEDGLDPAFFIDLKLEDEFDARHGKGVLHLILYLLDGSDILTHNGSVISSSYLTPLGEAVRERVLAGEFGEEEI